MLYMYGLYMYGLYMYGRHSLVSGLEKALTGKKAGDSFSVTLEPNDAYGIPHDFLRQRISIKYIATRGKLRPGMVVDINTTDGLRQLDTIPASFNKISDIRMIIIMRII